MQKRVARPVRQLDKAKPAIGAKPLHHCLYRRARRLLLKPRLAETRRRTVTAATPAAVIPAATATAKITLVKIAPPAPIAMASPVFHVQFQSQTRGQVAPQSP
jgi:hypothetical protein